MSAPKGDVAMNLLIEPRKAAGVTILHLNGRIVLGEETSRLEETLRELAAIGEKKVLLNLRTVTDIDSAGLAALVRCHSAVAEQGGRLKLLNVPPRIQSRLHITKLHTVFEMFDNEVSAVQSFTV